MLQRGIIACTFAIALFLIRTFEDKQDSLAHLWHVKTEVQD